jgi:hypothetical protein
LLPEIVQCLIELLLGYLSARVPLTKDTDCFVSPTLSTPMFPSRPPEQHSDHKQSEEDDQKNDEKFAWKVPSSETDKEDVKQNKRDDQSDRQHKQGTDHTGPW